MNHCTVVGKADGGLSGGMVDGKVAGQVVGKVDLSFRFDRLSLTLMVPLRIWVGLLHSKLYKLIRFVDIAEPASLDTVEETGPMQKLLETRASGMWHR